MKTWRELEAARLSPQAAARAKRRAHKQAQDLTLRELRQGLDVTQAQLALAANMTQSELSRLESRADHRISTLRRYVEALGGSIEVVAVIGGKRVKLAEV